MKPNTAPSVEERLLAPLRALAWRLRLYVFFEGAVRLMVLLVAAALVQYLLDRWLRLAAAERTALSLVLALAAFAAGWRLLLRPLIRRWTPARLAAEVDRRHPALADRTATAVEFAEGKVPAGESNSAELMAAVVSESCRQAGQVDFQATLNHRHARRRAVEGGTLLLAIATLFLAAEDARVWFARNWLLRETPWRQATHLLPMEFDAQRARRFPVDEPVTIAAQNVGVIPRTVSLEWQTASGRRGRESMRRVGERWECALGVLSEQTTFVLRGGDERTPEYTIQLTERPRVLESTATITPPAYTRLEPSTLVGQTVLEAPAGAHLDMTVQLNKPVVEAILQADAAEQVDLTRPAPDQLRLVWSAPRAGFFSFRLADADGISNPRPVRFQLKLRPDTAPRVELAVDGASRAITPRARLPLSLTASDAYGLTEVLLYVQADDAPPFELPPEGFAAGRASFSTDWLLDVAGVLQLEPGQHLRLWAAASDNAPETPNRAESEMFEFDVLSATDFLADLALREVELRQEFERLTSAQRGLRDALERILPQIRQAPDDEALRQRAIGLGRRQEAHARRVETIREAFADLLRERAVNGVEQRGDERRIARQVIAPLQQLGEQRMPAAADNIRAPRPEAPGEWSDDVAREQAEIAREMKQVLDNMLEWEGYREVVTLLTDIIEEQKELRAATGGALDSELDAILGLGEDPQPDAPE